MSDRRSKHGLSRSEWAVTPSLYVKRGLELPQTKLTPAHVAEIRKAAGRRDMLRKEINETLSNAALARRFGVHVRTIEKALSYESHVHVP